MGWHIDEIETGPRLSFSFCFFLFVWSSFHFLNKIRERERNYPLLFLNTCTFLLATDTQVEFLMQNCRLSSACMYVSTSNVRQSSTTYVHGNGVKKENKVKMHISLLQSCFAWVQST
jgi:hypothetical protein